MKTNLSLYNNDWYDPGAGRLKRMLWYITNALLFRSSLLLPYSLKRWVLKLFGARIGKGVVIKPSVSIKYPWYLTVGDHTWIGERVWIDNLTHVIIGNHVCISQGALVLSGNHDFTKSTFDLLVKEIVIEDGAWIGARAVITQGVKIGSHAVLTVGSVANRDLSPYGIYRGNPAEKIKERIIKS
ncbi:MAG: putative colanic acid biosynthesis acetyltransferase [Salibacteraceae bacterium]